MRVSALAPNGKQCWLEATGSMIRLYEDGEYIWRNCSPVELSAARVAMTKRDVPSFYWIICDGAEMMEAA